MALLAPRFDRANTERGGARLVKPSAWIDINRFGAVLMGDLHAVVQRDKVSPVRVRRASMPLLRRTLRTFSAIANTTCFSFEPLWP